MYVLNFHWTFQRSAQSYPNISFVYYSLKCTWSSSYKALKENVILFTLICQDKPNHILECHLSTLRNVDGVQLTSLIWQNTTLFDLLISPGSKIKIPNSYYSSAMHAQSYPKVYIVYSWKYRRSWSDKLYRKTSFFNPHLTPRDKMKMSNSEILFHIFNTFPIIS